MDLASSAGYLRHEFPGMKARGSIKEEGRWIPPRVDCRMSADVLIRQTNPLYQASSVPSENKLPTAKTPASASPSFATYASNNDQQNQRFRREHHPMGNPLESCPTGIDADGMPKKFAASM